MAAVLARVLTLRHLRELAGDTSCARGQTYFAEGHVLSLVIHGDTLTATVTGTQDYQVRLAAENDQLAYRCSCPVGADGAFCKHGVAVALAWLDAGKTARPGAGSANEDIAPLVSLDDLRPWLLAQPPAALAGFLLDTAARDDRLREKLLRAAARDTHRGLDVVAYRKSIDRATRTGGFIDYDAAHGFAESVREAIEPLRELFAEEPARADAVIELAEHALTRVEKAPGEADDSNGEISSVLTELQDLHLAACEAARPDPEELAARLFAWEMQDGWDTFYNAVETYADVLGAVGIAAYRRLAEVAWKKLPALAPGDGRGFEGGRFRITSIMEALARTTGDPAALVAIKSRDLSHAYHYLQIAEIYRDAKDADAALDWAERGLKAFPADTDVRLLEFLAEEYHRRQRHDEAVALIWRPFESQPSLPTYQSLKQHADRAAIWPEWRERALAHLRRNADRPASARNRNSTWIAQAEHDTLVRIFLWEGDVEIAWREAQHHVPRRDLALELAAAREKNHPADAIPIYLREAETLIAQTGNRSYEAAVAQLRKIKALHLQMNQSTGWEALLVRLRTTHKAKRNFIALVAAL